LIAQDQIGGCREVVSDQRSAYVYVGILWRGLACLDQDAPAPGVETGQHVADQVADHP
jgi:hypothetical protein